MLITIFFPRSFRVVLALSSLFSLALSASHAQTYTFAGSFGSSGSGNGQFNTPCFIALDKSDNIYVDDLLNSRVQEFTHDGGFLGYVGIGQFNLPLGITFDRLGNLYAANYFHSASGDGQILVFDSSGNFVRVLATTQPLPYGLAFGPNGNLYVADNHSYIQEFDDSGNLLSTIGSPGSGPGQLSDASGIKFNSSGHLYVAEYGNSRVTEFDSNGNFVSTIGSGGSGDGQLNNATDVALDSHGNIYVADYSNSRIVEFSSSGAFVQNIGNGQLSNPFGVAFDSKGNLFVVDRGNSRIVEFALVNLPPTVSAGGDRIVTADHSGDPANDTATLTLTGSATDTDSDPLSYTWTDSANIVVGTSPSLPLTLHPGTYTYTFTATDTHGASASDTATVTVNPAQNQPPTANPGVDQTVTVPHNHNPDVGTAAFTLDGSASSDPDPGDLLSYQWVDGANIQVGNTAQVTVSKPAGTYVFTLTVSDPYGASSQNSVTITVDPEPNGAPVLTAPATVQGDVGCPLAFSTSATDPDGDTVTYSLAGATNGATINSSTGLVSWTPSSGGSYTLAVRATDPYGATDTKSVSISVCPILIEAFTVTRSNKNVVTVQFNVRNTGSATVTGITLNSATLNGAGTTTRMPVSIGTLKAGATQKAVKLTFSGASAPPGSAVFIVNGTSAAGLVCANASVIVP